MCENNNIRKRWSSMSLGVVLGWAVLGMAMFPSWAQARDVRLALLVGNEYGWKGDPHLRYVLRGDLHPMGDALRRLGFEVRLLKNQNAAALREAFSWVQERTKRAPTVTTFLFYYTGHSDRNVLHMGPKGQQPLRYRELVSFLKKLKVARRFGIFDSCFSGEIIRKFGSLKRYRELVPKGARARRIIDLSKSIANQGDERSLQIMSSGLDLSWESRRYKASIFTYHLLKGLRGKADRDLDGKISVGELFDFVSDGMQQDIDQKPEFFGVVRRSRTYALAPAYNSRLWIGPQVLGALRVTVANFSWSWNKQRRQPLRLALIHGQGTVELKRKGQCWRQRILLPKGQEARLSGRWASSSCQKQARVSKGIVELGVQQSVPTPVPLWTWELHGGAMSDGLAPRGGFWRGGELGLRHRWFGVRLGVWSSSAEFLKATHQQLRFDVTLEGGYRWSLGALDVFVGGLVGGGLFLQDINQNLGAGALFRYGVTVKPVWWMWRHWGLSAALGGGGAVGLFGKRWLHVPVFHVTLGLAYRL